jgi:hypothetical protein
MLLTLKIYWWRMILHEDSLLIPFFPVEMNLMMYWLLVIGIRHYHFINLVENRFVFNVMIFWVWPQCSADRYGCMYCS